MKVVLLRRGLVNLLTALSLLLCAAVVALWVRSASHNRDRGHVVEEVAAARFVRRGATTSRQYESSIACQRSGMMWEIFYGSAGLDDAAWEAEPGWTTEYVRSSASVLYAESAPGRGWWPEIRFHSDPLGVAWFPRKDGKLLYCIGRSSYVMMPYWGPAFLFMFGPGALLFRRARKWRRSRRGLCLRCGYDLRASPDKCPECGTLPSVSTGE